MPETPWRDLSGYAGDALASVVDARQDEGEVLPARRAAAPASLSNDPLDHHDPSVVLVPVEAHCKAARADIAIEEGLLVQSTALVGCIQPSGSGLLARGVRMLPAAERG